MGFYHVFGKKIFSVFYVLVEITFRTERLVAYASPIDRFFSVALPLARSGFLTAAVLGFAHTLGEFGVVLMIGGNIPGETQLASIAIYEHVEALDYAHAHLLSGVLLLISFVLLLVVYATNKKFRVLPS